MRKLILVLIFAYWIGPNFQSLASPKESFDRSQAFFSDSIHEMHLWMEKATFDKVVNPIEMGGDACKDDVRYGKVEKLTLTNKNPGHDQEMLEFKNVGIKVRGNRSCGNFVKQFKIKFNPDAKELKHNDKVIARMAQLFSDSGRDVQFGPEESARIKNQSFYGFKSLSLRKSSNDPTLAREKIAGEIFTFGGQMARMHHHEGAPESGGAVYRVGFVRLFVHMNSSAIGDDFGIYNITESIEKKMFETRWGQDVITHAFQANHGGASLENLSQLGDQELFSLYEPLQVDGKSFTDESELRWIQNVLPDLIKNSVINKENAAEITAKLEAERKKTREILNHFSNQLKEARSAEDLDAFIDVDQVVSYMVAANLTGHWDSLVGNRNNDFLIFNAKLNKWQIVVWDLDNTFGTPATNSLSFNSVWNAAHNEFPTNSLLFNKIMTFNKEKYNSRFREFLQNMYDFNPMNDRIVTLRGVLMGETQIWEVLFRFKNHRYAHGYCGANLKLKAVIGSDLNPEFNNWEEKKPRCQ